MTSRLCVLALALLLGTANPVFAQTWDCRDRVTFPDGWSIMEQLYFDAGPAEVGPNFHISRHEFYANWYPSLGSLNAPFVPPPNLSFVVAAKHGKRARYGIFKASGREPLKIPIKVANPGERGTTAKVLFQPANAATHGILLEQQTWRVELVDQRGRVTGSADHVFPFDLNELAEMHRRHVAKITELWRTNACAESVNYDSII